MSRYIDLMNNAKKKNKFKVTDISPGLIAGKLFSHELKLIEWKNNTDEEKVEFSKIKSIKV